MNMIEKRKKEASACL